MNSINNAALHVAAGLHLLRSATPELVATKDDQLENLFAAIAQVESVLEALKGRE